MAPRFDHLFTLTTVSSNRFFSSAYYGSC